MKSVECPYCDSEDVVIGDEEKYMDDIFPYQVCSCKSCGENFILVNKSVILKDLDRVDFC